MKWRIKEHWLLPEVLFLNPIGWAFACILYIFVALGGEIEVVEG